MSLSRPMPWVAPILYGAVLVAGGYYQLAGLAPADPARLVRLAGFVGVLLLLLGLEWLQQRRYGMRPPRTVAVILLVGRLALYVALSTVDASGFSRALYLLLPFTAYFALGRRVAYGLGLGCVGLVLVHASGTAGWYRDPAVVSDLLMFLIGLVFALSMAAVAAEEEAARADLEASHRQLAEYASQAATLAAATERNRLARDIHDSLGHHLTAVSVQLEKAAAFADRDAAASRQALADARRSARHALEDVRTSVGALRTGGRFSLGRAVQDLVDGLGEPPVELTVTGDESRYPGPALIALYRAAQEGLTNVRKHAGAASVSLRLELGEDVARLWLADDGRGFVPSTVEEGFGLRGMRERLELVGGDLTVESAAGAGTRLHVRVPA